MLVKFATDGSYSAYVSNSCIAWLLNQISDIENPNYSCTSAKGNRRDENEEVEAQIWRQGVVLLTQLVFEARTKKVWATLPRLDCICPSHQARHLHNLARHHVANNKSDVHCCCSNAAENRGFDPICCACFEPKKHVCYAEQLSDRSEQRATPIKQRDCKMLYCFVLFEDQITALYKTFKNDFHIKMSSLVEQSR